MIATLRKHACLIAIVLATAASAIAEQPIASSVRGIGITVSSIEQATEFYSRVLGFRVINKSEQEGTEIEHLKGVFGARVRVSLLQLGDELLELTEFITPRGEPLPPDSRSNDGWFQHIAIVVSDMDSAYERLRQLGVTHASTSPQTLPAWNKNAAGIRAFYFRDPDGHSLELIWFPPDKGLPKWHRTGAPLFMGIDHTAIVVRDTDRSVAFYRDGLGMKIAGESENYGIEQERLNNVFGVRLRITSLRAGSGPGIELLEYLAPRDGRETPLTARSNDIAHWETLLQVRDPNLAWQVIRKSRADLVSNSIRNIAAPTGSYGAFLVKDPDRHVIQFISTDSTPIRTATNKVN